MTNASEPERRLEGLVAVEDERALRRLLALGLDFGCRPIPMQRDGGGWSVGVIGTNDVLERLRQEGFTLEVQTLAVPQADVGSGDRFEGGRVVPHGFGRKAGGRD